jgi:hypothetical protein
MHILLILCANEAALTKALMEEVEREFSASIAEIQSELEKIQVMILQMILRCTYPPTCTPCCAA